MTGKWQAAALTELCSRRINHRVTRAIASLFVPVLLVTGHAPVLAAGALFTADQPLKAVLTAPLAQVYEQKDLDNRIYMDGKWSYKLADGSVQRLDVKVRSRGNFRRQTCRLPPLRLNFRKKSLADTPYDGQDKLKMVSPCGARDQYQQYVAIEYLTYKLFELFSDYHFKVRLVELGYVDTDGRLRPWNSTNFLIEDDGAMAARYGMQPVKAQKAARADMHLAQTALVELFQLMIGNNDYSTLSSLPGNPCCHNGRLIGGAEPGSGYIPVPYDFDSSGLVNAFYAIPPEHLPIRRVTQRYFTGWCKQRHHYRAAIDRFNERRDQALALFAESGLLETRYRKRALAFIESFYDLINDERQVKKQILERCRGEVVADSQG